MSRDEKCTGQQYAELYKKEKRIAGKLLIFLF